MIHLNHYFALIMAVFGNSSAVSGHASSNSTSLARSSQDYTESLAKYSCPKGFQLMGNQYDILCIQQEKVSYRSPLPCDSPHKKLGRYSLRIDMLDQKDLCLNINGPSTTSSERENLVFQPKCEKGYTLDIRHGKDACQKRILQRVKQPLKKIR